MKARTANDFTRMRQDNPSDKPFVEGRIDLYLGHPPLQWPRVINEDAMWIIERLIVIDRRVMRRLVQLDELVDRQVMQLESLRSNDRLHLVG